MSKQPAPGPYEVVMVEDAQGKAGERWIMIRNADGAIATVYPAKNAEATANLLAASWEMLESLQEMTALAHAYVGEDPKGLALVAKATAIIFKVQGYQDVPRIAPEPKPPAKTLMELDESIGRAISKDFERINREYYEGEKES